MATPLGFSGDFTCGRILPVDLPHKATLVLDATLHDDIHELVQQRSNVAARPARCAVPASRRTSRDISVPAFVRAA
jgi:hypothetical protein